MNARGFVAWFERGCPLLRVACESPAQAKAHAANFHFLMNTGLKKGWIGGRRVEGELRRVLEEAGAEVEGLEVVYKRKTGFMDTLDAAVDWEKAFPLDS